MRKLNFVALLFALPGLAAAQATADLEQSFMAVCTEAGNEVADCTCIVQNWTDDIAPEQVTLAMQAVEMSYQSKPPDPTMMQEVMPLIMGLTDYAIKCATGELLASGLSENSEIPQTGDATEQALLLERMTRGEANLSEMMRYDQLVLDGQSAERQSARLEQDAADARAADAQKALRSAHEAELDRIHSRPLPEWDVAEFETLFGLYCRMGGATEASCNCGWGRVTDLARTYALPYLASRSEGDDVLERLSSADFYGTLPALSFLNEQRAQCDGL